MDTLALIRSASCFIGACNWLDNAPPRRAPVIPVIQRYDVIPVQHDDIIPALRNRFVLAIFCLHETFRGSRGCCFAKHTCCEGIMRLRRL